MMRRFLILAIIALSVHAVSARTISGETVTLETLSEDAIVNNGGTLVLTGDNPMGNHSVDLADHSCSLILSCAKPTQALEWMSSVTIGGKTFDPERDRLSMYGHGSEVIPDGWAAPLTIYSGANYTGENMVCDADIYYRGKKVAAGKSYLEQQLLGAMDNNIRSFRLKRGYSACFANNNDGTGFSRVFVATDRDLEVAEMPEGLEFASFVRVAQADRIGKQGICGLDLVALTRSPWYYSWGASDDSKDDYEFVPMRHNRYWDGYDKIGSRIQTFNVLGFNEPDHGDQSNISVYEAMGMWPDMMASGLRAGSPAPDAITKGWLKEFIQYADSLCYRVDFVATHMYWDSQTPEGLTRQINNLCEQNYGGRPMWITEWNNGANWTGEAWPDREGLRLDADFEPLYEADGSRISVTRPHTQANSKKMCDWLGPMLQALDDCKWLERHSLYNWVEDARMLVINNKLTPAGKIFADFRSQPGFDHSREYIHRWHIAPPYLKVRKYTSYSEIQFYDQNGETGINYIVERRKGKTGKWEVVATLVNGVDYKRPGNFNTFRDMTIPEAGHYQYRMRATSYKGELSRYSRIVDIDAPVSGISEAAAEAAPTVTAQGNTLTITSPRGADYAIYAIDGRMAANVYASPGAPATVELPSGIYFVGHRKIAIGR